jgi:hypothetical protein
MSQRRLPGSLVRPALRMIGASFAGQRTATMPPSMANSAGPIRAGRSAGNLPRQDAVRVTSDSS